MRAFVLALLVCTIGCRREEPAPVAPAPTPAPAPAAAPAPAIRPPEDVVRTFGQRMKQVPTTAYPETAQKAIKDAYTGLVDPALLAEWSAATDKAPGRQVSSPWPDRIEIESSTPSGADAVVTGALVEATSTGDARRIPVEIHLRRAHDAWLITSFAEDSPAAVVRDYYDAISAHDYDRAYQLWGENGPPNQTREAFAAGFAHTKSVRVTTGVPSHIEGAAGSQYVDVPVTVTATTDTGEAQHFEGAYTLRRAMVDRATSAQRKWHLYKAAMRTAG